MVGREPFRRAVLRSTFVVLLVLSLSFAWPPCGLFFIRQATATGASTAGRSAVAAYRLLNTDNSVQTFVCMVGTLTP